MYSAQSSPPTGYCETPVRPHQRLRKPLTSPPPPYSNGMPERVRPFFSTVYDWISTPHAASYARTNGWVTGISVSASSTTVRSSGVIAPSSPSGSARVM